MSDLSIYRYMKLGIVHFKAFPEVILGNGPIIETLRKIAGDNGGLGDIMEGPAEETPGWHAGEMETSTVWAADEGLIDMDKAQQDKTHAPAWMGDKFSKKDGAASVAFMGSENIVVPMEHHEYSDTATIGNPLRGTKEKGARYFQASGEALAAFLEEVKKFDIKVDDSKRHFPNRA